MLSQSILAPTLSGQVNVRAAGGQGSAVLLIWWPWLRTSTMYSADTEAPVWVQVAGGPSCTCSSWLEPRKVYLSKALLVRGVAPHNLESVPQDPGKPWPISPSYRQVNPVSRKTKMCSPV